MKKRFKLKKRPGGNGTPVLEHWQISDETTKGVIPPGGFLQDLLHYTEGCTHAPLWFQMASALAMIITACAGRELRVIRKDGAHGYYPLNLWPIIVGQSGDGKDAAVRPALRILRKAAPEYALASDFTPEALQSALGEGSGIGLIHKSELSQLFKAGRRSYSADLLEYLMALYNGDPWSRLTKKDGHVAVTRPRVSIIGNVPPDVLIAEVSRSMWSSGLLPRMTPFASVRTRWAPCECQDPDVETDYAAWVREICIEPRGTIAIPPVAARVIDDWYFKEVESKRLERSPDIFSALSRLQEKAYRITAAIAISESTGPATGTLSVRPGHAAMALEIIKLIQRTTIGIFSLTAAGAEAAIEQKIIEYVRAQPGVTAREIGLHVGLSRFRLRPLLEGLERDLDLQIKPTRATENGGTKKGYHYVP